MTNNLTAPVNDIRDIKPPLEISDGLAWLWWTLVALVVVTVLLLAWRYFLKRVTRDVVAPPINKGISKC